MSYSVHTAVNPLSEIHLARSSVPKPEYLLNFFWGGRVWGKRRAGFHLLFIQVQQELVPCRVSSVWRGSRWKKSENAWESIWRKEGNKWKKSEVRKGGHVKSKISKKFASGKLNVPRGDILSQLLLHNRSIKPRSFAPRLLFSHYRRILDSIKSAQALWTEKVL